MKLPFLLFFSFVICMRMTGCATVQLITDEQAVTQLRHFYVNYISERSKQTADSDRKIDSLLHKYASHNFNEERDAHPSSHDSFLPLTPSIQVEWLTAMAINKSERGDDIYEVSWVDMNSPNGKYTIRLKVTKTSTAILIDGIIHEGYNR